MLLQSYPELRTRNRDVIVEALRASGYGTRIELPSGGSPDQFTVRRADFAEIGLSCVRYDSPITIAVNPHDLVENCGHVLCVGRTYRTATKAQRMALMVRDRHCRFPGCRVDVHRCEAHHVQEWELGGPTCLSNLVLLCRAHHVIVHEGGWRIFTDPPLDPGHPDHWQFQPPDDRRYDSPLTGTAGLHWRRRPLAS